jgi:3-dehydroquinate synthase
MFTAPRRTAHCCHYNITIRLVRNVSVTLPSGSYTIVIEPGMLSRAGEALKQVTKSPKAAIITDSHVGELHLQALENSLNSAGIQTISAMIPAGEQHKNLMMLMPVYDQFLSARFERSVPVIALGGGVVGDMAGFVAATILRGVPLVQIPTTLLAMVDASVGGKTGVDHPVGKNLIGAFHQPIAVLIDPQTLATLPADELHNGLAECIKHDLIRDADSFGTLQEKIPAALNLDMNVLSELIAHNVAIKAKVVEADPFEKSERAHLNFGHTFGHAIESVSKFSYSHGQAVALGMCAASFVSHKLGYIDSGELGQIVSTIRSSELPARGLKMNLETVIETMGYDKKVKDGRLRLVLLEKIGRATIRDDVPRELIREALESIQ